jgi:hypothetical protein
MCGVLDSVLSLIWRMEMMRLSRESRFVSRHQPERSNMRSCIILSALAVTVAFAGPARASNPTINGASCVPGDPAIQNNLYLNTAGSTSFQSTATGLITLYCPVAFPDLISTSCTDNLVVTYADTDGTATVTNITAQLIKLDKTTGSLTNIGSKLDSNSFGSTSGGTMSESLGHCFDGFAYYYVRIDLNRSATTAHSTLYGVRIEGT